MAINYIPPTIEMRQELLKIADKQDRLVKEAERERITSVSRQQCWILEREGKFPKRKKLSERSVAWLLSDLLWFVYRGTSSFEVNDGNEQ